MRSGGPRASKIRALAAGAVLALVALHPSPAHAQAPRIHELRHDVPIDLTIIGTSLVFLLTTESVRGVKPASCRWCDRTDGEDTLNGLDVGVRDTLRWRERRIPGILSNVVVLGIEPVATITELAVAASSDNATLALPVDALVISEAVAVSIFADQVAKLAFARERPFVHAMSPEEREKAAHADNNVSFYSGHTALGFSLAAASGTVASLRGYRLAPVVWGTLLPLAAATGYLRIATDKHYFTDVLGGALMGSAFGVLLPLLFHSRRGDTRVENAGADPTSGAVAAPLHSLTPMVTMGGGF